MRKLVITEPVRIKGRRRDIGETVEVEPALADELIELGLAADSALKKVTQVISGDNKGGNSQVTADESSTHTKPETKSQESKPQKSKPQKSQTESK